ncbi:hypothetical protein HDU87_005926 [Geranomyces variabilis]|uniref:RING-type domain-containing protein n=1 Tax=Geranomyces variabilis TaxID=109894 RepID=A0AAD5TQ69_9FUNG|nr:hypothetical protein HDU87_005926 [Geranomyces variabilis]
MGNQQSAAGSSSVPLSEAAEAGASDARPQSPVTTAPDSAATAHEAGEGSRERPSSHVHRTSGTSRLRRRQLFNLAPFVPSSLIMRGHGLGAESSFNLPSEPESADSRSRSQALRVLRRLRGSRESQLPRSTPILSDDMVVDASEAALSSHAARASATASQIHPTPMDLDDSPAHPPASGNDGPSQSENTPDSATAAASVTNGHIIRNMLQTVLSSINALDNSQAAATGGGNPNTDTDSNRTASPTRARTSPNARLAELLQSLQAQHGGSEQPSVVDTGTPSLTSLLRNLRTRALGRNPLAGHAEHVGGSATAALPGNDPRRSPVPVLILIGGGTMRGLRAGRAASSSQSAPTSAAGAENSANLPSSSPTLAEQSSAAPEVNASTDASPPDANPAAAPAVAGSESAPIRRRSINFMIYFIPAAGGAGASATNGNTEPAATAAQPPEAPADASPASNAPVPMDVPLTNILGNLPNLETPSRPSPRAGGPGPAGEGHAPSPFTHATPINLFGGAPGATHNGSLGNIPLTGTRALEEEVAIAIVLQIVSNLLREGSMNGPGGLLGGTLSLDVDLSSAEGGPPGQAGQGAGGAGDATYEDFLRLAELLGPARPRHAAAADVERELPILKFGATPDSSEAMEVDEKVEEATTADSEPDTANKVSWRMDDLVPATREKCMICLSMYENGDDVRVMRCRHGFHKGCLDQWLTQYVNSCPLCRDKAVSPAASSGGAAAPETASSEQDSVPTVPGERRGLLRRVWEMFGPGRTTGAAAATDSPAGLPSTIPVPNGRNLPAAVVVLLG